MAGWAGLMLHHAPREVREIAFKKGWSRTPVRSARRMKDGEENESLCRALANHVDVHVGRELSRRRSRGIHRVRA